VNARPALTLRDGTLYVRAEDRAVCAALVQIEGVRRGRKYWEFDATRAKALQVMNALDPFNPQILPEFSAYLADRPLSERITDEADTLIALPSSQWQHCHAV
jgi:uncharacterized protein (DUF1810 family)